MLLLLTTAASALLLLRLEIPGRYAYDEVFHAYTASRYLAGDPNAHVWYAEPPRATVHQDVESAADPLTGGLAAEIEAVEREEPPPVGYTWNHPPLGLWMIAGGIAVWGDDAFGWRFGSAVFGALGLALLYLLALSLSGSRPVAALAAALLPLNGLWFVQARIGMLDVFLAVFMMAALLFLHLFLTAPAGEARWPLLLSGAFLGLAVATKWSALYPAVLIVLVVLWRLYGLRRAGGTGMREEAPAGRTAIGGVSEPVGRAAARRADTGVRPYDGGDLSARRSGSLWLWAPVALVALPLGLYLLAYAPFFASGHTPDEWLRQQAVMLDYHRTLTGTHLYQSAWWSWPHMLIPVHLSAEYGNTTMEMAYALGNPLLFWGFVPAVLAVCWRSWGERNIPALAVLGIGFFGQWLPWALVPRSAFLYHFLPAVPLGCLAVAMVVAAGWRRGGVWRVAAGLYIAAVVAAFIFFYPVLTSLPLTPEQYDRRMWLASWR